MGPVGSMLSHLKYKCAQNTRREVFNHSKERKMNNLPHSSVTPAMNWKDRSRQLMNKNSWAAAWTPSLERFLSPSRGALLAAGTNSAAATRGVKSYSWKQNPITWKMKAVTVPWSTEERSNLIAFVFQDKLPRGQFHVSQGWFTPPSLWLKQGRLSRKAALLLTFISSITEIAVYFDFHTPQLNAFQFRAVKLEGKLLADINLQQCSQELQKQTATWAVVAAGPQPIAWL